MKKAVFEELLESVKQAKAIERGELKAARVVRIDPRTDIVRVRGKLGLSQSKFASILGISVDTLQNWEQGRRSPTGPAKVLLKIAAKHLEVLLEMGKCQSSLLIFLMRGRASCIISEDRHLPDSSPEFAARAVKVKRLTR